MVHQDSHHPDLAADLGANAGPDPGGVSSLLRQAALLLAERDRLDAQLAALVGRPSSVGALGEWIAGLVFDINLEQAGNKRGYDGRFTGAPRPGATVNVKWYGRRDVLDLTPAHLPDFYLVLAGPPGAASSSRGTHVPFRIEGAYLFEAPRIVATLRERGVGVGTGSSVRVSDWEAARIHPARPTSPWELTAEQHRRLDLFAG